MPQHLQAMPYRLRVATLMVLASAPFLVLAAVGLARARAEDLDRVMTDRAALAAAAARTLDAMIAGEFAVLRSLTLSPALAHADRLDEAKAALLAQRAIHPVFQGIGLYDADGTILAHTDREPYSFSVADRDYYAAVRRTRAPFAGELILGRGTGVFTVPLAVPTRFADGADGLLVAPLALGHLERELHSVGVADNAPVRAVLVDRDGKVFVDTADPAAASHLLSLRGRPDVDGALAGGSGAMTLRSDGTDLLSAFAPVPGAGWGVLLFQPTTAAFADADQRYGRGAAALLSVLLLTVVLGWLLGGRLARAQAEEHRARTAAERAAERTARLQAVTAALAEAATPQQAAEVAVAASMDTVGAAAAVLGLLVDDGATFEEVAIRGFPRSAEPGPLRMPVRATGQWAETLRRGEPVWVEDEAELRRRYPDVRSPLGQQISGAAVTAPLSVGGRVLGVLGLRFATPRPFDAEEQGLIAAIAGQCAQALERSRLYQAEREARAHAEEAVRARDEFLSIASHELRTPVTVLKGQSQLLLRGLLRGRLPPDRLERALGAIDSASNRLNTMIGDLLDVSRLQTGQFPLRPESVDLAELLADVVARYGESADSPHQVVLDWRGGPCLVEADAVRLEQVFANLMDNAVKYTPGGGTIRVCLDADDTTAHVVVSDPGMGLPPGEEETIFEPFGRARNAADRQVQGLGLGLYICRRIVEHHGGTIRASSGGEGQGTTVRVALPRRQPAPVPEAPAT